MGLLARIQLKELSGICVDFLSVFCVCWSGHFCPVEIVQILWIIQDPGCDVLPTCCGSVESHWVLIEYGSVFRWRMKSYGGPSSQEDCIDVRCV